MDVFFRAAIFSLTKQKGGLKNHKKGKKETQNTSSSSKRVLLPLPMASSSTRALLARFGKRGVSAIGRASSSSAETIRPFAASALGGIASDLAPVLGQDENSVFLKWSAPETQNFAHRGILAQDECKVGWKSFEAKRSFPFPPLSLSLREEREREDETDRTRVTRSKLFAFIRLFLSRANHPLNAHTHSLFDSLNERMHRSRLYRLVCASPRKRRRIVKRPPLVFGLMPDRDTSPRRRTVPRTSSNTWRLKAPRNERRLLWNKRLKTWVDT